MNWYNNINIKTSGIIVNPGSVYEAELQSGNGSQNMFTEINYDDGNEGINTISISVLAANQKGLLYSPNYLVVQMRYPPKDTIDQKVLEGIRQSVGNLIQTPYSEGKNPMMQMMENAIKKPLDADDEGNVYQVPQEGESGIVDEGGPLKGVTVHTSTLVGVYGPYPDGPDSRVRMLISAFKRVLQPMLDANLLEFIEINSNLVGRETIFSQMGQQRKDDTYVSGNRDAGYFYYVMYTVLSPYPT